MTRFHEQMKKVRNDVEDYYDVSSNDDWTIEDYRDFFWCVEQDYLVQAWDRKNSFMINEEWEGEDVYAIEFLEEEEEDDDVLKCPDSYSKWGKCPPEMCYDCDESRK